MKKIDLLVIALGAPLLVGVYENGSLIESKNFDEQASEALILALCDFNQKYHIQKIIYANTPGSFMGLKVAFVILKSYAIAKDCELFGVSGFALNAGGAIRANKNFCFVQENGQITLKKAEPTSFVLPQSLNGLSLSAQAEPVYCIEPV